MSPEGKFSLANLAIARRSDDLGGHLPPMIVMSSHSCHLGTRMVFGERAMDLNAKKGLKWCGNSVGKGH